MLKAYFRLISSLMKSRVFLESLQKNIKKGWDSFCFFHLGHRIVGMLPILCIAGFKGREKWISLYMIENILAGYFLNHVRKSVISDIRTENMVYFKKVSLWNEFESFVLVSTIY